jgi:preprotein translocase subunit YajC
MNKPKITAKEALMQIGNLLKMDFAKIQKFETAKLADGTEIMWDGELAEGTAIMVVAEDGNQMPAPDATHELEDGTMVTTVGGLVTAIEGKKEKVEVEVEMAAPIDMAKIEERMAACEEKMKSMETKMSEMFATIESKYEAVNKLNESKFEAIKVIVDEIAEEPVVEQPKPKQSTFSKADKKKTAAEMMAAYKKFTNQN